MKKVLSVILSIIMMLSVTAGLNLSAYAETMPSSGSCGTNVNYTFASSTGTLTISGNGKMDNYTATAAYPSPFDNQSSIKKVIINSGVTSIGNFAFYDCSGLTSITIPNSITSIGERAFEGCNSLMSITVPDSVTSIGDHAFMDCSGLTSLTIGKGVKSIGYNAFLSCSGLTSIVVNSGNAVYDSRNNCNAIIEKSSNTLIAGCRNTVVPNTVIGISDYSFFGCTGLTSIIIPDSVTSIGECAFDDCYNLSSVSLGNGLTSIEYHAFSYCTSLTSINIPCSVTDIGEGAFSACKGLTGIEIPDGVKSIESKAFFGCSGIKNLTIPDSVISIGDLAFCESRNGLTSVVIGKGVENISYGCFAWATALTSVTIPKNVSGIDEYAFQGCTSITDVYYGGTKAEWNGIVISDYNESLTNATIHCTDGVINEKTDPAPTPGTNPSDTPAASQTTPVWDGTLDVPLTLAKPVLKAKAAKKSAKLSWNKVGGAKYYEIQYGLKSNFKGAKTKKVKAFKSSVTIKKLKKGKKYYFRIRTVISSSKSAWSKKKSVKVK